MARETIASLAVRIGVDLSEFTANMQEFRRTWGRVGSQIRDAGTQIGTTFTAVGGTIAAGLGFAVKTAMDFDAQMARVGAIAGATGSDLEALRQTALQLGASTSKSATEVAQGMELMAAKGYDAQQVIAAMPGVISAAEASGEDMALVADTVASALNSFKLEAADAARVADVLAKSANTSAAGVEDLQYAFKYAAPVAASLGISLEEVAAATGLMADAGMRGEQAGTTLRMALSRLVDPPKEAANKMRELGIAVTDAQGNMLPFPQILANLRNGLNGLSNSQKAAALATIFGVEAMTGMLTLVEAGPEKFTALTNELKNSAGASAAAAAQMKNNLKGSLEELSGSFETLLIQVGTALAPAIRTVAEALTGIVNAFNALPAPVQTFIAVGAALAAVFTLLVGVVGFLVAGFGALAAAEWAAILPIAGFVAGIAAIVAGLAALGYGLVLAYQKSETFRNIVNQAWASIKAGLQALWNFVQPAIQAIADFIIEQFTIVKEWWHEVWPNLQQAFMNIWNAIWSFLQPVIGAIVAIFKWAWPFIKMIIVDTWNSIKAIISSAINIVMNIINAFAALFTGNWTMLWESIKQIFASALTLIWNWLQLWGIGKVLKFIGEFGAVFVKHFSDFLGYTKTQFSTFFQSIWQGLTDFVGRVLNGNRSTRHQLSPPFSAGGSSFGSSATGGASGSIASPAAIHFSAVFTGSK